MTLPLETGGIGDQYVRRALENVAQQFPLGSEDLANGSVTATNLASGAVTSSKLATGIVLELVTTGTTRKISFGSSSATWSAAVLSAAVTIAHGLGVAPAFVGTQTQSQLFDFKATADATNLTITGYRTDNIAASGTVNFYWVAIG